jgi:5'-nucleotidase
LRIVTRVLVTNDDGIDAQGIHVLATALHNAGFEVLVVAPTVDRSGTGAAIGILDAEQHLDVKKVEIPGAPAVDAYALDGPPGMCVAAARLGAFGEAPGLVVSGINSGCNTGRAILHSGTVGAALTAQSFGVSALAVSVDVSDPWRYDTAARVAVETMPMLLEAPARSVLNLNVPARAYDDVLGLRWARLAAFGSVRAAVSPAGEGKLQFELRAHGAQPPPDSDQGLVNAATPHSPPWSASPKRGPRQ